MCLLVAVSRLDPGAPLVIAANRDERLERPATAITVLHAAGPRVLGGRDEEAGGTWLAVNEYGVVAGLTNRPSPDGRDPSRRSRGELPLALAGHRDAPSAVADFVERFRPRDFNPAWLLVGDRTSLFALDMTGDGPAHAEALTPGVHILENHPLHTASAKVTHVRALLGAVEERRGDDLVDRLRSVLVDHSVPTGAGPTTSAAGVPEDTTLPGGTDGDDSPARPVETLAACVHTESYGTRSSTIVRVAAAEEVPPVVLVADGHPCTSAFADATDLWRR